MTKTVSSATLPCSINQLLHDQPLTMMSCCTHCLSNSRL